MKKLFLFNLIITGSILLSSCNKWLDVKPKDQLADEEIFESESSINDLLTGVYTNMATRDLYGDNLTVSFVDVLARRYSNTYTNNNHRQYNVATHDYTATSVIDTLANIWKQQYFGIAQLNFLLNNIDEHRQVFSSENSYSSIKAQALGLRAYLHFDLLRLFAPSFASNSSATAIPYMSTYIVIPQQSLSVDELTQRCLTDLSEAESLLSGSDQSAGNRYWFNIWAVKATKARIYAYRDDKTNALLYADEVINSGLFSFVSSGNVTATNPNRVFPTESIFSLYSYDLPTVSEIYFTIASKDVESPDQPANHYLLVPQVTINSVFEQNRSGYGSDPRYLLWWVLPANTTIPFLSKFWTYSNDNTQQYRMPLIRLSEMYLIATESANGLSEAAAYFNAYRVNGRFLPETSFSSEEERDEEILKEYVKEFYGEGQLFYYYKRKGITVPGAVVSGDRLFVLPMPEEEQEFRF